MLRLLAACLLVASACLPARSQPESSDDAFRRQTEEARKKAVEGARRQTPIPIPRAQLAADKALLQQIDDALKRAAAYLVPRQGQDGSWGGTNAPKQLEEYYSRVAITAMAADALAIQGADAAAVKKGVRFVLENGLKDETEVRKDPENTVWVNFRPYALAYGLAMASRLPQMTNEEGQKYEELYIKKIKELQAAGRLGYSSPAGRAGTYEGDRGAPTSFQTALLLGALADAKAPAELIKAAADELLKSRDKDGHFSYRPGGGNVSGESAVARDVIAEAALFKAGRSDIKAVQRALDALVDQHVKLRGHFLQNPNPGPHTGPHQWSDYYDLFGLHWGSVALLQASAASAPPRVGANAAAHLLASQTLGVQKKTGEFVDSRYGGPDYGTATAMLTLLNLRQSLLDGGLAKK